MSGIGQMVMKYVSLFPGSEYKILYKDEIPECDEMFIFPLPVDHWFAKLNELKSKCKKKLICMTICETETVHPDYGKLFEKFDRIAVASDFCRNIFKRQFPETDFYVIHAHVPLRTLPMVVKHPDVYVFYHIGNVPDQRKNFNKILEAFLKLNKPDTLLLVKATSNQPVILNIPRVQILNGLMPDEGIDEIHAHGDCYVSASSSEGIGLGAVEAAMHDKPVIITEYGGAVEYIKTPYTVKCGRQLLENDDFLFQKGMEWGKPDFDQLLEFMNDAYEKRLRHMEHSYTRYVVGPDNVKRQFLK